MAQTNRVRKSLSKRPKLKVVTEATEDEVVEAWVEAVVSQVTWGQVDSGLAVRTLDPSTATRRNLHRPSELDGKIVPADLRAMLAEIDDDPEMSIDFEVDQTMCEAIDELREVLAQALREYLERRRAASKAG
jgi:hypothetical protein